MKFSNRYETEVQEVGLITFFAVGKDLIGQEIIDDSPKIPAKKAPVIQNKKEVVHKLIKYFKQS